MAHPIRPESYIAMDNFYTSTVYEKVGGSVGVVGAATVTLNSTTTRAFYHNSIIHHHVNLLPITLQPRIFTPYDPIPPFAT